MITEVDQRVCKSCAATEVGGNGPSLVDHYTPLQPLVRAPLQTDSGIQGSLFAV